MKVLLDHNLPRRFRAVLPDHAVLTTRQMRWEKLGNGALLRTAADGGFGAFLSIDKNLQYQQNLRALPLPVIVLDSPSNAMPDLLPFISPVRQLLSGPLERALYLIASDGRVTRR